MTYLICLMATSGHILRGLFKFESKPITVSHHLAIFGVHWSSASGDIIVLVCHVTSHGYVRVGVPGVISIFKRKTIIQA